MKVFLTGASGFLGSHILDLLCAYRFDVTLLLRSSSNTRFIADRLSAVEVHYGSLDDVSLLKFAMQKSEVVIHCAGKTKALSAADYEKINHLGTRNVVAAANACRNSIQHVVHISSLSVSGPGVIDRPAEEADPPRPISAYGRSKMRGENALMQDCRVPWTILRPGAVYGPRDVDFFKIFQIIKRRFMPLFNGGKQALNLLYVQDMAKAVQRCLGRPEAWGKIYHVAAEPPCTNEDLFSEIATQMGIHPVRLSLPFVTLYPLCLIQEILSQLTRRPSILSFEKISEIHAPGWVCATERIRRDLNFVAATRIAEGVGLTLAWYQKQGWL